LTFKTFIILYIFTLILNTSGEIVASENGGDPGVDKSLTSNSSEAAGEVRGNFFNDFARKLGFGSSSDMDYESYPDREGFKEMTGPCLGNVIDTIIVTGNRYTKAKTITRVMASRKGLRLDNDLLFRDDSYLRGLGFFSVVNISVEQAGVDRCRLIVHIEERPKIFMKYPLPVANYDFDKGLSYGGRWRIKNFRGAGEDILMTYEERPSKERGGGIAWYAPWVADRRVRLAASLYNFTRLEAPGDRDYIRERNGGRVMVGFPLTESRIRQVWLSPAFGMEKRLTRLSTDSDSPDRMGEWVGQMLIS